MPRRTLIAGHYMHVYQSQLGAIRTSLKLTAMRFVAFLFGLSFVWFSALSVDASFVADSHGLTYAQWQALAAVRISIVLLPLPRNFRVQFFRTVYDDKRGIYGYTLDYGDRNGDVIEISANQIGQLTGEALPIQLRSSPAPLRFRSPRFGHVAIANVKDRPGCVGTPWLPYLRNRYEINYCGDAHVNRRQLADWISGAVVVAPGRGGHGRYGFTAPQWQALSTLEMPVVLPGGLPVGFWVAHVQAFGSNAGKGETNYDITYSNGASSFEFSGANGGFGGVDVSATAFAARFHSKILGSGRIDRPPDAPGCYADANGPMMLADGTGGNGYSIQSCGGGRIAPSLLARMVTAARVVYWGK